MNKLAIITTHPIQYYAPVFKLLHQRENMEIRVFYTWGEGSANKYDPGFDKKVAWDIPVLDGYPYEWVKNTAKDPGTHHFNGILNPQLVTQVKAWQPDAILVYGWGFRGHLTAIRYFKNKIPVFFRGDSTLLDEKKGVKNRLRTVLLKWVYRHVDHAFYVGANCKAYFIKYGLKDRQLTFAPHAIDNKRFAGDRKNEAQVLRQGLGIGDSDLLVLFAGKLEQKKDPLLLLDAFINLSRPNVHLLLAGNGPLEDELKFKAAGNANVHFIDFQNQSLMPVVYQACDVFCLPSGGPGESWGLAVNEAMASGRAILISDKAGAAIDLVRPGQNGQIFSACSLSDISYNLDELINKGKNGLAEMGRQSKLLIESWSFEEQVKAMLSIIKNG